PATSRRKLYGSSGSLSSSTSNSAGTGTGSSSGGGFMKSLIPGSSGGGGGSSAGANTANNNKDIYFEQAKSRTSGWENGLVAVMKGADKVVKVEKANGTACQDVASRLVALNFEDSEPLLMSVRKLAKAFQLADDAHSNHSNYLSGSFVDGCTLHARAAQAAQVTLNHRLDTVAAHESACKTTAKKEVALERLKASTSIRQDKVDVAVREFTEARTAESETLETLKKISTTVREEYARYDQSREEGIRRHVDSYVRKQMEYHVRLLRVWESVDVRV
ncbi:Vacuolar protein sorting-associated protein 17, partial [Quaeritorhiza haematococci]